ncbi:MAG: hypothetical protein KC503_40280 [Myxococcales bacterium]|nr:hypothetical protein [Myxococcales bacterium]
MRVAATLCACALLVVAPARASASGQRQLARAKKLLEQFKDRAALRALQRARRARGNSRRLRAEIWMYIGIANYNLLKQRAAGRAFRRALRANRGVQLPGSVSPKIRALWQRIEASLPKVKAPPVKPPPVKPPPVKPPVKPPVQPPPDNTNNGGTNNTSNSKPKGNLDPVASGALLDDKDTGGSSINWPAWIAAGVALGAAGAAIGVGLSAKSEAEKAADLEKTYEAAEVSHAKATERALITNIMIGVAGAAAVTSAIFFIVRGRRARTGDSAKGSVPRLVSAGVSPTRGGALLGLSGRLW